MTDSIEEKVFDEESELIEALTIIYQLEFNYELIYALSIMADCSKKEDKDSKKFHDMVDNQKNNEICIENYKKMIDNILNEVNVNKLYGLSPILKYTLLESLILSALSGIIMGFAGVLLAKTLAIVSAIILTSCIVKNMYGFSHARDLLAQLKNIQTKLNELKTNNNTESAQAVLIPT